MKKCVIPAISGVFYQRVWWKKVRNNIENLFYAMLLGAKVSVDQPWATLKAGERTNGGTLLNLSIDKKS